MGDYVKTSDILDQPGAQTGKQAVLMNEENLDGLISHYNGFKNTHKHDGNDDSPILPGYSVVDHVHGGGDPVIVSKFSSEATMTNGSEDGQLAITANGNQYTWIASAGKWRIRSGNRYSAINLSAYDVIDGTTIVENNVPLIIKNNKKFKTIKTKNNPSFEQDSLNSITIKKGQYAIDGLGIVEVDTYMQKYLTGASHNILYYLYLAVSSITGPSLSQSNFYFTPTIPAYVDGQWKNGNDLCVFAVRTNSVGDIVHFHCSGDRVFYTKTPIISSVVPVSTPNSVPLNTYIPVFSTSGIFGMFAWDITSSGYLYTVHNTHDATNMYLYLGDYSYWISEVPLDAQLLTHRSDATIGSFRLHCNGYSIPGEMR